MALLAQKPISLSKKNAKKHLSVSLDEEIVLQLQKTAQKENRSVSGTVNNILKQCLAGEG